MQAFKQFLLFVLLLHNFKQGISANETVLVAHNNVIVQLGNTSTLVSADQPIRAFDIHQLWRQLFWATDYYIYRTPLYDTKTATVIAVTGRVGSLAVDWVHHHVYWSDVTRGRIEAVHTNGKRRRVVYETELIIEAMALDPQLGKIFWIEYDPLFWTEKSIKYSLFDGSFSKTIFESANVHEGGPLAIDVVYKSVYFYQVNGSLTEQWEINYDGITPYIKLLEKVEQAPTSLGLVEDGFYYSNDQGVVRTTWAKQSYTLVYGNETQHFTVLDPYYEKVDGAMEEAAQIRVVSDSTQPKWRDQCDHGGCQQDCLVSSHGPDSPSSSCTCGYGYKLDKDNSSCIELGYLYYSTPTTFGKTDMEGGQHMILYNASSGNIQAFDINMRSNHIYWSDLFAKAIYRAPADQPTRKAVIVPEVSAFGVAIDWLHDHLYWTNESSIMVASLDGEHQMALIQGLDDPSEIVVDPVKRLLFWAECGGSLSLRRAGLGGSDVTSLTRYVSCDATLTLDPRFSTIYWQDWTGSVYSCDYECSTVTRFFSGQTSVFTVLHGEMIWVPLEPGREVVDNDLSSNRMLDFDEKPSALKVVKSSQQPLEPYSCEDRTCGGLCIPSPGETVPKCLSPGEDGVAAAYTTTPTPTQSSPKPYLKIVSVSPYEVTLKCAGPLLKHPIQQPFLHLTDVGSLVPRPTEDRISRTVRVADKNLAFTIDELNPATTYTISVRNRVTRASYSLTVHTPPPPLGVERLPVVTLPGAAAPLAWRQQGVHYFSPNPWEGLLRRRFYLLLVSKKEHSQTDSVPVRKRIFKQMKNDIKDNFVVLKHYKSEDDFDDNPAMHLSNVPWGEEFRLAMVQVLQYEGSPHLDMVYSDVFELSDPNWEILLNSILRQNSQLMRTD